MTSLQIAILIATALQTVMYGVVQAAKKKLPEGTTKKQLRGWVIFGASVAGAVAFGVAHLLAGMPFTESMVIGAGPLGVFITHAVASLLGQEEPS